MSKQGWVGIGVVGLVLFLIIRACTPSGPAREIKRLLALDHQYSQLMESETPTGKNPNEELEAAARIIRKYTSQARRIDLSNVPKEVAAAYYLHVSAWEDMATTLDRHPHIPSIMGSLVEGFIRGLLGDWTGGAFEKEAMFNEYGRQLETRQDRIEQTWREVEALAIKHGARIRKEGGVR